MDQQAADDGILGTRRAMAVVARGGEVKLVRAQDLVTPEDSLHHAAVARQRVDIVVEQVEPGPVVGRREPALGDRHADAGGDPLAERAGGGLDAGCPAVLGVAGAGAVELAEALDGVERH